jgi:tetratricopeptide (TPR) repeat protein
VAVVQAALVHYPRNLWLCLTTANLLKDPAEKPGYWQAALAVRQQNPVAYNNLAVALVQHKKYTEAVEAFEKSIALAPKSSAARNLGVTYAALGKVLLVQGRFTQAKKNTQKALDLLAHDATAAMREQLAESERCLAIQQAEAGIPVTLVLKEPGVPAEIQGRLADSDPLDFFLFTNDSYRKSHAVELNGGKSYQIDLLSMSKGFDTYLRVETSGWQALIFNDDICPPMYRNSRLVFTPTADGVYRLVVNSYNKTKGAKKKGAYTLKLVEVVPTAPPELTRGELKNGDPLVDGKYAQEHKIELTAGTPYVFELRSRNFDTYLQLLDASEKLLTFNDDVTPDDWTFSRIDFTPQETGSYFLRVTSYLPRETGAYTLSSQSFRALK